MSRKKSNNFIFELPYPPFQLQSNLVIRNVLIRNKLVLRNHFPKPIFNLLHKDKTLLALRNNFRVTNKFLITNFDCIRMPHTKHKMKNFFQIKFLFFGLIDHNKSTAKIEIRQKNSLNLRYIHIRLHKYLVFKTFTCYISLHFHVKECNTAVQ